MTLIKIILVAVGCAILFWAVLYFGFLMHSRTPNEMGWYDNQMRLRKKRKNNDISDFFIPIIGLLWAGVLIAAFTGIMYLAMLFCK